MGNTSKEKKWAFQRLQAIEGSIYGHEQAPCLLKAIADQPIEQCEFSSHIDIRQWNIGFAELMVLLERPGLSNTSGLDLRDISSEHPEQTQWVLQNAWHSEQIKDFHLNCRSVSNLPEFIRPRSFRSLTLSGEETNANVFEALSEQKQLEVLDLGHSSIPFSMDCIAQSTRLQSLVFRGHIDNWVPLILQNLRILELPLMTWGDWIEDLQLHQMSAFQIGSTVPSREILHFEELTHLDMHMPKDAIDSFSLHSLVLRGGELDTSLVQQIRIGCPLLRRLHLIDVDIQANVMPALVDLDAVTFNHVDWIQTITFNLSLNGQAFPLEGRRLVMTTLLNV